MTPVEPVMKQVKDNLGGLSMVGQALHYIFSKKKWSNLMKFDLVHNKNI